MLQEVVAILVHGTATQGTPKTVTGVIDVIVVTVVTVTNIVTATILTAVRRILLIKELSAPIDREARITVVILVIAEGEAIVPSNCKSNVTHTF